VFLCKRREYSITAAQVCIHVHTIETKKLTYLAHTHLHSLSLTHTHLIQTLPLSPSLCFSVWFCVCLVLAISYMHAYHSIAQTGQHFTTCVHVCISKHREDETALLQKCMHTFMRLYLSFYLFIHTVCLCTHLPRTFLRTPSDFLSLSLCGCVGVDVGLGVGVGVGVYVCGWVGGRVCVYVCVCVCV